MNDNWDLGMLQVFLSKTGITTGKPCLLSSSVCAKYSSEMRPAHSIHCSLGLHGLEMSAHFISMRLIRIRFSGDLRTVLIDSPSPLFPFSSSAAKGLLMLLTNLLTCSKCFVISVAKTMSIMTWRRVRYSFLFKEGNN